VFRALSWDSASLSEKTWVYNPTGPVAWFRPSASQARQRSRATSFRSKVIRLVPLHQRPDSSRPANPDAKAITEEAGPSFYSALGSLPADLREILLLHEDEGWSY
jgi:DNA-directed RNA polymerase specialized sigma24 family protein